MKKWISYTSDIQEEKFDIIIIGSGMSGLTTAVLLAQHGLNVLILEKHFKAGGFTHTRADTSSHALRIALRAGRRL